MKRLSIIIFLLIVSLLFLTCQKENNEKNSSLAFHSQSVQVNSPLKFNSFNEVIDYMFDDNRSIHDNFVSLGDYMDIEPVYIFLNRNLQGFILVM